MKIDRWQREITPYPSEEIARYRRDGLWQERTCGEELHISALRWPDAPAVFSSTTSLTYAELDGLTDRIGAGFISRGLLPGDAVLLQVDNTVESVLAWYGLLKAAVIPVATLVAHRGHELRQIGDLTHATAHIVQADFAKFDLIQFAHQMAADAENSRQILTIRDQPGGNSIRVEDLGAELTPAQARTIVERAQRSVAGDDVVTFQLSGGTTGTPKVIPRLHSEYWYNAKAYAARLEWDSSVRVAQLIPLVHNAGIACGMHAAHAVGAAIIICSSDPDQAFPVLARHGVTDAMLFPGLMLSWRQHVLYRDAFASLRRVVLTAAKVPVDLFQELEAQGVRVIGLFGTGEGLITATRPDDPPAVRNHSVGYPISDQDDVRILEQGGETELPDGTIGELCVKGPYTIRGYLSSPERNAEAFTSDGLYRTGDYASATVIDGVRCYIYEGRMKELVNRGGEKVNAAEIESLVAQIPGVVRVALIPVPDERLGERGCLCIEIEPGLPEITLNDVASFLHQREVARFKWPEYLRVFDDLPKTEVGKIDKRRLVKLVVDEFSQSTVL